MGRAGQGTQSEIRLTLGREVVIGAGMGVDSGLPDFRGTDGFWRAYPALGRAGISFQEAASPRTFDSDPALAWGFYGHRLDLYRETAPHAGFSLLQEIAARLPQGAFVFTSNVDGQFQKAGFDASRVCECYGSIHHLQCTESCTDDRLAGPRITGPALGRRARSQRAISPAGQPGNGQGTQLQHNKLHHINNITY